MKQKDFEVIYKFTVAPTAPFPSALNWSVESIGELIRCKDCKHYTGRWCAKYSKKQFDINDICKADDDFCSQAERKEE